MGKGGKDSREGKGREGSHRFKQLGDKRNEADGFLAQDGVGVKVCVPGIRRLAAARP